MIVAAATALGVLSAIWSWERLRRLASIRLAGVELVWAALVIQVLLLEWWASHLPVWASVGIHYVTYAMCLAFIALNRALPGAVLIAAGAASNLIAIAVNGGSMPADPDAWRRAGLAPADPAVFTNSAAQADARLAFLGDVFAVPAGWPLSNVFSVGDVAIVIGATYLAHRVCARPVPTERFELSLTRT